MLSLRCDKALNKVKMSITNVIMKSRRNMLRLIVLIGLMVCYNYANAQEAYAVYTNDGTLTFYYDKQKICDEYRVQLSWLVY